MNGKKLRRAPRARGFALLIVVLLVALIAVSGVALLDIVNVDLLIVGQHRRTLDAQTNAMGAMMEVVSDQQLLARLPDTTSPQLEYRYSGRAGTSYVRDPDARFGTSPMGPANSAYVDSAANPRDGYRADVRLLRVSNPQNVGLTRAQAVTYEVRVVADVSDGQASQEVRTQIGRIVTVPNGTILTNLHAR